MNRKTILPLIAAALTSTLALPASAIELPRDDTTLHVAEWRDGRWLPPWFAQGGSQGNDDRWRGRDDDDDDDGGRDDDDDDGGRDDDDDDDGHDDDD